MSIGVHCTSCTSEFHVTAEFSGKLIRCPSCKEPVRVPDQTTEPSQPEISAAAPVSREPVGRESSRGEPVRRAAIRQEPARPRRQPTRSAAQKPARNSSLETQGQAANKAPSRRSARVNVARRNHKAKSRQNFPVGLAVGLGIGIAGLLIAVAAFVLQDSDDNLIADSEAPSSADTSVGGLGDNGTFNEESESRASSGERTTGNGTNADSGSRPSGSESTNRPTSVAANTPNDGLSVTHFNSAPDTSGLPTSELPSPNSSSGGSALAQPSRGQGSAAGSSDASLATTSGRPPVLNSWSSVNSLVGPSIIRVDVRVGNGGSQGSGFVIDAEKGVAVTNYHVVEGASQAQISFENGDKIQVDGYLFLDSKRDIAIIKFDPAQSTQAKLRGIPFAVNHPLKGEEVAAFGAPIGLDFSMTQNIVSAIRPSKDLAKMLGITDTEGTWIQHGVSISSGNSGGPLINKRGEVVGMNTMGLTIGQNLNFAISGVDITEGFNSQLPKLLAVSARNAPVRHRSGGSSPGGGSFDDPYERPEIEIVDVVGEERGQELLAKMKTLTILSIAFSDDPNGTVTGAVRTEARKTLGRCKVKLTSSRSADYVMLMVMHLERSGIKSTLRMTTEILTKDDDAREVLKIWELTEDVGTISMQSIYRAYLPPNLKRDIQKYFSKVRIELLEARRNYSAKDDEKEPGKDD